MNLEIKTWQPTSYDFSVARILMELEDYSKMVQTYSKEDFLYTGLLYSTLSLKAKFSDHEKQFREFLNQDLWTAESVLENKEEVEEILNKYGLKKKSKTVFSTAQEWRGLNLRERMREDSNFELGFQLRDEMTKTMYGVGDKFASLFLRMCGYEELVPVDSWATKYVESRITPLRHKRSGLKHPQYLIYEQFLTKEAKKFGVSPAHFQAAIYAKFSTWKDSVPFLIEK